MGYNVITLVIPTRNHLLPNRYAYYRVREKEKEREKERKVGSVRVTAAARWLKSVTREKKNKSNDEARKIGKKLTGRNGHNFHWIITGELSYVYMRVFARIRVHVCKSITLIFFLSIWNQKNKIKSRNPKI